ncbi:hypothetical protein BU17DRAFT_75023 [Hysterangium stoloniferum]|nr:hypothetical protein BU17DRAFT_75023 [Hysterangium stoloniferum]
MSVKEIVRRFEASPSSGSTPSSPVRTKRRSPPAVAGTAGSPLTDPSPSPARFIPHPLLKRQSAPVALTNISSPTWKPNATQEKRRKPLTGSPSELPAERMSPAEAKCPDLVTKVCEPGVKLSKPPSKLLTQHGKPRLAAEAGPASMTPLPSHHSHSIPDDHRTAPASLGSHRLPVSSSTQPSRFHSSAMRQDTRSPPSYAAFQEDDFSAHSALLPQPSSSHEFNDIKLHTFPRPTHDNDDKNDFTSRPPSPSATLITAKTVFSCGAPPLLLPALDNYLSAYPAPNFPPFTTKATSSSKDKGANSALFPPMDLLAASGRTVEELETNSVVPHWWENRGSVSSSLVNLLTGVMGSSAIASYYSLQGLYDGLQVTALLLSTIVGKDNGSKWQTLFLGTIPNALALNLGHTTVSLILFIVCMAVSGLSLYHFHVSVRRICLASSREGLQSRATGSNWGLLFSGFFLTLIYLPMSTISVHALLWSDDFWPDRNVTHISSDNEINFAPLVLILATSTLAFVRIFSLLLVVAMLTVWFPIRVAAAVRGAVPRVDKYTELGGLRNSVQLNHEYERLLARDKNPLSFLYKDFRVGWGAYKSAYLGIKLSTLLIIAVFDTDNCIFQSANTQTISAIRQGLLVFAMTSFLILQSFVGPFLDPVNNASEWISRAGYVAFAIIGSISVIKLPSNVESAFHGPVLYIVYAINYSFTIYFLFINLSWTRRLVKKLTRRIDFSIDMFSPNLDISTTSRHVRRRVWQETISVLLYASKECAMPQDQKLEFLEGPRAEDPTAKWPPYLVDFRGTPAERHAENLKILRDLGGLEYAKGVALNTGLHSERMGFIQERIQRDFIGPDSYWSTPAREAGGGCFGNAWWMPFPPTLVMRYDSGEFVVLRKLYELEAYIKQNEDHVVLEKRSIRMALRALDGRVVRWPYTDIQTIGSRVWCWGSRYTARTSVRYESCVLSIDRKGSLSWKGLELGSGFNVQLTYAPKVHVDGTIIGLSDDYDLTPQLARFLATNREVIHDHLGRIDTLMQNYRNTSMRSIKAKDDVLGYNFLCSVYSSPKESHQLAKILTEQEKDLRVRQIFLEYEDAIIAANARMSFIGKTEASTWWYLYWDDLWRRNHDTIATFATYASDFDPHYSTSIAYRLLPRAALEAFLSQRGLLSQSNNTTDFIHSGILNKLYFRLNQIVFRGSEKAIQYHLGEDSFEVDLEELDLTFSGHAKISTMGTGGGTDHDDASIRARPMYRWEGIFDDPLRDNAGPRYRRWLPKLAVWFGIRPFWQSPQARTSGVSLDVRLDDGSYVLLEHAVDRLKKDVI